VINNCDAPIRRPPRLLRRKLGRTQIKLPNSGADPAKQLERQVTTNSDGHFILPQLPPSLYKWMTLTFEAR
jgi:hypothetical protein